MVWRAVEVVPVENSCQRRQTNTAIHGDRQEGEQPKLPSKVDQLKIILVASGDGMFEVGWQEKKGEQ